MNDQDTDTMKDSGSAGYHVHAVKLRASSYEECDDDDPQRDAFGLYRIGIDGLLEHVEDYPTRAEAEGAIPQQNAEMSGTPPTET